MADNMNMDEIVINEYTIRYDSRVKKFLKTLAPRLSWGAAGAGGVAVALLAGAGIATGGLGFLGAGVASTAVTIGNIAAVSATIGAVGQGVYAGVSYGKNLSMRHFKNMGIDKAIEVVRAYDALAKECRLALESGNYELSGAPVSKATLKRMVTDYERTAYHGLKYIYDVGLDYSKVIENYNRKSKLNEREQARRESAYERLQLIHNLNKDLIADRIEENPYKQLMVNTLRNGCLLGNDNQNKQIRILKQLPESEAFKLFSTMYEREVLEARLFAEQNKIEQARKIAEESAQMQQELNPNPSVEAGASKPVKAQKPKPEPKPQKVKEPKVKKEKVKKSHPIIESTQELLQALIARANSRDEEKRKIKSSELKHAQQQARNCAKLLQQYGINSERIEVYTALIEFSQLDKFTRKDLKNCYKALDEATDLLEIAKDNADVREAKKDATIRLQRTVNDRLASELTASQESLEKANDNIARLEQIQEWTAMFADIEADRADKAEAQSDSLNAMINGLTKKVAKQKSKLRRAGALIDGRDASVEKLQNSLTSSVREAQTLFEDLQTMTNRQNITATFLAGYMGDNEELALTIDRLNTALAKAEGDIDAANELLNEGARAKIERDDYKVKVDRATQGWAKSVTEAQRLYDENERNKKTAELAGTFLDGALAENERLAAENNGQASKIERQKKLNATKNKKIRKLTADKEDLERKLDTSVQNYEQLSDSYDELQDAYNVSVNERISADMRAEEAEKQAKDANRGIRNLNKKLTKEKKNVKKLERENATVVAERDEAQDNFTDAMAGWQHEAVRGEEARTSGRYAWSALDAERKTTENLQNVNENLRRSVRNTEAQLNELLSSNEDLENAISHKEREIEELNARVEQFEEDIIAMDGDMRKAMATLRDEKDQVESELDEVIAKKDTQEFNKELGKAKSLLQTWITKTWNHIKYVQSIDESGEYADSLERMQGELDAARHLYDENTTSKRQIDYLRKSLKELYEEETKNWPKLTPDKNVKIKGTEIPENENDDFYTL